MAGIREISGRIRSVQDTKKITNAMYMISSTKLRKAKKDADGNLPYFENLQNMLASMLRAMPELEHPFLDEREEKKEEERVRALLVVTADKGLAGAYNHNVLKVAESLMQGSATYRLYVIGEVGRQYFAGKRIQMAGQFQYTAQNPTLHRARVIAEKLIAEFLSGEVDRVSVCFTALKNGLTSEPRVMRLLPLSREEVEAHLAHGLAPQESRRLAPEPEEREKARISAEGAREGMEFFPSAGSVLDNIIPNILVGYIYSALVDSYCSEQNDRMIAMDAANRNANEMIKSLSVQYNRERQAIITQEITEVSAGSKAQKKKRRAKEKAEP